MPYSKTKTCQRVKTHDQLNSHIKVTTSVKPMSNMIINKKMHSELIKYECDDTSQHQIS